MLPQKRETYLLKSWKDSKLLVWMFTGNQDWKIKEINKISVVLLIFYLYINLNTSLLLLVKFVFVIKKNIWKRITNISYIYNHIYTYVINSYQRYIQFVHSNHFTSKESLQNKKHRPNSQSCGLQGENTANTDEGPYNSK